MSCKISGFRQLSSREQRGICLLSSLIVLFSSFMFAPQIFAQVTNGILPFGSFGGGPDVVNLANLNSRITIPIFSKPGRGLNFNYSLTYDTSTWYPVGALGSQTWTPSANWGWSGSETDLGRISDSVRVTGPITCGTHKTKTTYTYTWSIIDGSNVLHQFPGTSQVVINQCTGNSSTTLISSTVDGSGYKINVTGTTLNSLTNSYGLSVWQNGQGMNDRNGNEITTSGGGGLTDTLGVTALTIAGSGTPSSPMTYTYTPPDVSSSVCTTTNTSGVACYAVKFVTYSVQTAFGCSGIADYGTNGTTTANLVSEIDLPDYDPNTNPNSRYTFSYEQTPNHPGFYTGRLVSVTLPTGGSISYAYSGGSSGFITCADGTAATIQRTVYDGTNSNTWTYAHSESGSAWSTLITDPQANQTNMNFQTIYETQRQVYQGSVASGTLLRQWTTCYNGNASNCNSTLVGQPITQRTVTDQYGSGGLQCQHIYKYNSVGGLTEQDDYDYGSGGPGGLLRQILITFASLGNITAFRQQVTIKSGSGTIVSQTNYNYDENTPGSTSDWGITQHASVTGSRGNLTSINYPVSGLGTHFTYYDTGVLSASQDVNTATTTFRYSGTNNAFCNGAFPTSVDEPSPNVALSRSFTWNCTGGVMTQLSDENGNNSSVAYNDQFYWRPASSTDQSGNVTNICYAALTSAGCPSTPGTNQVESYLNFNSGNSTVDKLVTSDGLGRVEVAQTRQGLYASNSNFDSVETAYNSSGELYWTCLPYSGTAGQTSSNCPSINNQYDALGRITSRDYVPAGGSVSYSYPNNDVLLTVGPAPSGESTKQRQLEYDALGRLTSVCEITSAAGSGTCGQTNSQTGYWTKYTYDALGNLLTVTQNAQATSGSQQTRSFSYDAMSRLTYETNAETGTTSYTYDSDSTCGTSSGDLVKKVDAAGNIRCSAYDLLHRVTTIKYPSGPNSTSTAMKVFYYDAPYPPQAQPASNTKGQLASAGTCLNPTCTGNWYTFEDFSYSAKGELSDLYELTPNSGGYYHTSATFWPNGALNTLNGYIGSTLNYSAAWSVDGEGRPYSTSAGVSNTTYNASSQPTAINFSSGDSDSFTYDSNTGRMTQYKYTVGSSPQSVIGNLTWNSNGTLSQLAITDPFNSTNTQTCNYSHDDLVRIANANCGNAASQTFSYDPFGNIYKQGNPYAFNAFYSTSTNQITCIGGSGQNCSGGTIPTYDSNGNVTNDGLHSYTWDVDGNSVTADGIGLTFDAFDRMVEQNRSGAYTQIVYSPTGSKTQIFANGQSTPAKNFVPLPGGATAVFLSSGTIYVRHPDWLGSSRFASTTSSRTMYFDTAYAPFGEPYSSSGTTDLNFTGMNADTTSGTNNPDYDFLFREYSIQGRWVQPDPAGLAAVDGSNPQSWNRYAYVANDPVDFVDPLGLDPQNTGPACSNPMARANGGCAPMPAGSCDTGSPLCGAWQGFYDPFGLMGVEVVGYGIKLGTFYADQEFLGTGIQDFTVYPMFGPIVGLNSLDGIADRFTLGLRKKGQTFNQCMAENSANYSAGGVVDLTIGTEGVGTSDAGQFFAGNIFTGAYAGVADGSSTDAATGMVTISPDVATWGMGTVTTYGRRTSDIRALNLAGKRGLPKALSGSSTAGVKGEMASLSKVFNLGLEVGEKATLDAGLFGAEVVGCSLPQN